MEITISVIVKPEELTEIVRLFGQRVTSLLASPEMSPVSVSSNGKKSELSRREEALLPPQVKALAAGNIAWTVDIDGIPTRWNLDYQQAHLPVVKGGLVSFQGSQYRVTKIYGTSLYLTNIEAEKYTLNREEALV